MNLAKPMRIKEGSSRPGELVPWKGEIPRDIQSLVYQPFCFPSALPPIRALQQAEQHPDNRKYPLVPRADALLAVLPAALTLSNRAHEMHAHMPGRITGTSGHIRNVQGAQAVPSNACVGWSACHGWRNCWLCPLFPYVVGYPHTVLESAVPAACSCALAAIPLLPEPHQALTCTSCVAVGFVTLHQLFPRLSQSGQMTNG